MAEDGKSAERSGWLAGLSPRAQWRMALGLITASAASGLASYAIPWAQSFGLPIFNPMLYGMLQPFASLAPVVRVAPWWFSPIVTFAIAALDLMIVIALALIPRQRPRIRLALLVTHAVWLALLLAQLVVFFGQLNGGVAPDAGLWLGWLSILLGAAGLTLARQTLRRGFADVGAGDARAVAASRGRFERASFVLATVSIALWGCGYYALPWATQGCAGLHVALNHFVDGTCAGYDAADVLVRASAVTHLDSATSSAFGTLARLLVSAFFLYTLLGALAVWALAWLWGSAHASWRYAWLLGWIIIASSAAGLTAQGAGVALANPRPLVFGMTGPWVYGPGLAATLAGLALTAIGLVGVYIAARGASAQASLASSLASSRSSPTASSVGEKM
ncbi:MAG TPA: hypothetical protein VFN78_07500 [Ktedonobacterales bacterium]|nr:hypothetical protein [Ktedonobacterales bacterium]